MKVTKSKPLYLILYVVSPGSKVSRISWVSRVVGIIGLIGLVGLVEFTPVGDICVGVKLNW
jgi:hypothetical protein